MEIHRQRLIIVEQGFLDLTEINISQAYLSDANGGMLKLESDLAELALTIVEHGEFILCLIETDTSVLRFLKLLPSIAMEDAVYIGSMIAQSYVPYQNNTESPGKSVEEIQTVGRMLFPFSQFSFQLAMYLYDWTTPSFVRLIYLKIFQYTGIPQDLYPVDKFSIADKLWAANFLIYSPSNADFMRSFMIQPSPSRNDVYRQLSNVATKLHPFSEVENRLLSAAMQSMPRTPVTTRPQLFSGQIDILGLGLDCFGIEFFECPLNQGPSNRSLKIDFATAMSTDISPRKIVTTKMGWSFTDTMEDAMHYSNGILLVANHPEDSFVWETAAYVTPLSDDPGKIEYTFAPGSHFEVQWIDTMEFQGTQVAVINLLPISMRLQTVEKSKL